MVLSGGGASGFAHIGVLKALEENEIPIDYITGTSAGALVGAMYSAGYSPEQIEVFVLSETFQLMARGELKENQNFLLRVEDDHAGMVTFSFAKDSLLRFLPTNFTSSALLDFEMVNYLGTVSASRDKDFNNLFVPFRCVASDITKKESVIFDHGDLNAAVRASMTYPFYLKPTKINGTLLFDGGLYNNFPANIMYQDFNPDFIIGSNVSYNAPPPDEDDLLGQVTNMLVSYSDFELPCEEGLIIEPQANLATFEFDAIEKAIDSGYQATLKSIDSIRLYVTRKQTKEELQQKRKQFRSNISPLEVSQVNTKSEKKELSFTRRSLLRKRKYERLTLEQLERRYFRLYAAPQIDFIFPTVTALDDSTYALDIYVKKAKEFKIDVGGHISSRPVNTGYFGVTYQTVGQVMTRTHLESYFGKFYGSAKADFTLDLPLTYPISTQVYFTMNRWDYFRSFATFFEDVQPSFLIQNEMYAGVEFSLPVSNTIESSLDARVYKLDDRYYQTENFTNKDTTDQTSFNGMSYAWSVKKNSLNRKQFANSGHYFSLTARLVAGREHSISGSTAINEYDIFKNHQWFNLGLEFQTFIVNTDPYHLGLHGQVVFSGQTLFSNFTASTLAMTEFSLIPDAKSYFLPEYRSPQFAGIGMNHVFTIKHKLDLRFDGYIYQPFIQVILEDNGDQSYSEPLKGATYMASASAIYHSFIGPLRFTANYFPEQEFPLAFQFSMGYILFNDRAIR